MFGIAYKINNIIHRDGIVSSYQEAVQLVMKVVSFEKNFKGSYIWITKNGEPLEKVKVPKADLGVFTREYSDELNDYLNWISKALEKRA